VWRWQSSRSDQISLLTENVTDSYSGWGPYVLYNIQNDMQNHGVYFTVPLKCQDKTLSIHFILARSLRYICCIGFIHTDYKALHRTALDVCQIFQIPNKTRLCKQAWQTTEGGEVTCCGMDDRALIPSEAKLFIFAATADHWTCYTLNRKYSGTSRNG
jgi:hypothetical protein